MHATEPLASPSGRAGSLGQHGNGRLSGQGATARGRGRLRLLLGYLQRKAARSPGSGCRMAAWSPVRARLSSLVSGHLWVAGPVIHTAADSIRSAPRVHTSAFCAHMASFSRLRHMRRAAGTLPRPC